MRRGRPTVAIDAAQVYSLIRSGMSVAEAARALGTHRNTLYDHCKADAELRDAMTRALTERGHRTAKPERVTLTVKNLPAVVLEYLEAWAAREGRTLNEVIVRQLTFTCEVDVDCEVCEPNATLTGDEADAWRAKFDPYTVLNESLKEKPSPPE